VARVVLLGHVGQQQFQHQLLRGDGTLAVGDDLHAGRGIAAAGGGEHALAVDLHHAGAAVAHRFHAFHVAQARNLHAFAVGDLQQRLGGAAADLAAVQAEADGGRIELRQFLSGNRVHCCSCLKPVRGRNT
jgi:hypothetical protein